MNGLGFTLMGLGLAALIWNVLNAIESWRYLRARRLRLVKPRRGVVIKFTNQPTNHSSKVPYVS